MRFADGRVAQRLDHFGPLEEAGDLALGGAVADVGVIEDLVQPAATVVFAQIVDGRRNVVLGNQVTPIPVVLDGQPHTVTRPLEGVAAHVSPDSQYRLQVIDGTNVYGPQRSTGAVTMSAIAVSLPVADPRFVVIGARVPSPCAGMSPAPARRTRGRRLALALARLGGRARAYRTRR